MTLCLREFNHSHICWMKKHMRNCARTISMQYYFSGWGGSSELDGVNTPWWLKGQCCRVIGGCWHWRAGMYKKSYFDSVCTRITNVIHTQPIPEQQQNDKTDTCPIQPPKAYTVISLWLHQKYTLEIQRVVLSIHSSWDTFYMSSNCLWKGQII